MCHPERRRGILSGNGSSAADKILRSLRSLRMTSCHATCAKHVSSPPMTASDLANELARCCRGLWEAGLLAGSDGNVSARHPGGGLLVTPRGLLKGELGPADMVRVDLDGRHLDGCREATTELDLH